MDHHSKLPASSINRAAVAGHALCWVVIILHVVGMQYLYAAADRLSLIDHDAQILRGLFAGYPQDPAGCALTMLKAFLAGAKSDVGGPYPFSNLLVCLNFLAFGRSAFVFKMSQTLPLLSVALAVYGLAYASTRRTWAGLLAALLTLRLPLVVTESRTFFVFLPAAAACLGACWVLAGDAGLRSRRRGLAFLLLMWLGSLIHVSALLFLPFFFLFWLLARLEARRYALMACGALLIFAQHWKLFYPWLLTRITHSYGVASVGDIGTRFSPADIRAVWGALNEDFGAAFLAAFALSSAVFLFLRLARGRRVGRAAVRAPRAFVLQAGFLAYLAAFYYANCVAKSNLGRTILLAFYPLAAAVFVSMVALAARAWSGRRVLACGYAVLCIAPVMAQLSASRVGWRFATDSPGWKRMWVYDILGTVQRCRLEDDVADVGPLLSYMDRENRRRGGGRLRIARMDVTLRGRGPDLAASPGIDLDPRAFLNVTNWFLAPSAFFNGLDVQWDVGRDAARAPFLIVAVANDPPQDSDAWELPKPPRVLSAIERMDGRTDRRLFRGRRFLAGFRLHRNLFLYAYRRDEAGARRF